MVKDIGKYIKSQRKASGDTQKTVAEYLGISEGTYSRIENNKVSIDYEKAVKLSKRYRFNIENIYDEPSICLCDDYLSVKSIINYLLKNLTPIPDVAKTEYGELIDKYIDLYIESLSQSDIYLIVAEENQQDSYDWLFSEEQSIDEFIEKICKYILTDRVKCLLVEEANNMGYTGVYEIECVIESIYVCCECGLSFFGVINGKEVLEDEDFCEDCYDELPECENCGCKYINDDEDICDECKH